MPIANRVLHHGLLRPRDEAFRLGRSSLDYGRLALRSARVHAGLGASPRRGPPRFGIQPEGRLLALALGNDPRFAECFVGGTAAPHACAVLDPKWGPAQVAETMPRLAPDLLVAGEGAEAAVEAARALGIPVVAAGPGGVGDRPYEDWLAGSGEADPGRAFGGAGDSDGTFLIGFTSGTTSLPKAFRRSRGSWAASLAAGRAAFGLDAASHTLAPGPLAHGLTLYAMAETLEAGAAFLGSPRFDPRAAAAALSGGGIRRLVAVPAMLSALLGEAGAEGPVFAGPLDVVTAGAKLDPGLRRSTASILPGARFAEYYGASELGFVSLSWTPSGDEDDPSGGSGVGRAFPGVEIEIRAPDGRPLPAGAAGTVFVRSPLVCDGYLWGQDGTGFRVEGEWATVGDVGWLGPDGSLHLVGRGGGMLISGGNNVYPAEVEAALKRLDGVDEAVVVGVPDPRRGHEIVAVLSGPSVRGASRSAIAALCRRWLPGHKIPRRMYAVRAWPLTTSGKLARREVEEWVLREDERLEPLPPGA